MSYGGDDTQRDAGLAQLVTKIFEILGVLNKGSSKAPAAPDASTTDSSVTPVSSNAMNVTRVGGLAALVSSVGAAAIALFGVDKSKDKPSIVVSAYVSVGAIVAAALIAAAIIVVADIRTRGKIAVSTSPQPAAARISSMTANGDITLPVDVVRVDATSNDVVLTLPDAAKSPGARITVKRIDATGNSVRIAVPQGQTIDGAHHVDLAAQWDSVRVFSTLENWERD